MNRQASCDLIERLPRRVRSPMWGSKLKIYGASCLVAQVLTVTGIADSYRAGIDAPDVAAERGRVG
jgi:hypothetical protein